MTEWTLANVSRHNTTTKTYHADRPKCKISTSNSDLQWNQLSSSLPNPESTWCPTRAHGPLPQRLTQPGRDTKHNLQTAPRLFTREVASSPGPLRLPGLVRNQAQELTELCGIWSPNNGDNEQRLLLRYDAIRFGALHLKGITIYPFMTQATASYKSTPGLTRSLHESANLHDNYTQGIVWLRGLISDDEATSRH